VAKKVAKIDAVYSIEGIGPAWPTPPR